MSKAAGCTINDLFLAFTTGAIRRCIERHDDSADNIALRLAVTVNLRTGVEGGKLGNQSGMVFSALPIGSILPTSSCVRKRRCGDLCWEADGRVVRVIYILYSFRLPITFYSESI